MSKRSHCQQCGRRLRDAIFCPRCGQFLCSGPCLDEHEVAASAFDGDARGSVGTAAGDAPLPRSARDYGWGKYGGWMNASAGLKPAWRPVKSRDTGESAKRACPSA